MQTNKLFDFLMITIHNLSFYFGSRPLYKNASLQIKPKTKIGLIGANGTGKSTLLRLITGEYQPDEGIISKSSDCTIGFLNQDLLSYQSSESILTVALQAFERQHEIQAQIDQILHRMETDYSDSLLNKLTRLQEEFEALGGYVMESEAEKILEGLGFTTADLQRPLKEFSGGWRMRVMLAKLLLQKPSLLMLDEPTNHLDLPSIQWVEEYLYDYEGSVMVVSHDRYFLDNVCDITVEVANQKLNEYSGNYSFFLEEKALRMEVQQGSYENQQRQIRQTERFISRFKAKASKARQVQSRVKALERLDLIDEVVDATARVNFRFSFDQQSGKIIASLIDVSKSFGDLEILKDANITIEKGDKIALIGANGRGKSTLLRIIAGTEAAEGEAKLGYNVKTSFYAQHQLESLHLESNLLEELKQMGTNKSETELRGVLGCFLFSGDDVFKKIKVLSGGEKSRVALAKVLLSNSNFLLLDEPTNHLDMISVNILIQALQQYEGSFLVVSHDRHFVEQIANKIWYIENRQLKEYLGTYEEYEYWQSQRPAQEIAKNVKDSSKEKKITLAPQDDGERKRQESELRRLKASLSECETKIAALEKEKQNWEDELAKPSIYADPVKLAKTTVEYDKVKNQLDKTNADWENLIGKIDELK